MSLPLNVVGIGGSFRPKSSSGRLMQIALDLLSEKGHNTEALLLYNMRLPGYETCEQLQDYPGSVHLFLEKVRAADALILSTPVYHGTISGGMKNAIDFLEYLADDPSPYLSGKVVALMSTSGGSASGINAINTMDYICRALHSWVCPTTVTLAQSFQQFDEAGNLLNEQIINRLQKMTSELEFAAARFRS